MSDVAKWEERYRTGDIPWDTGRPSGELLRVVREEQIQPCRAIEVGCGMGTNAVWLAEQGFDVTGVDLSSLAVERARARAVSARVSVNLLMADVLDPPHLGDPYPFLFDRGCYHVVRRHDVGKFLQTLERITRPGAVALVLAGNAREPQDPGPPVVSEEEIRRELGQLFEIRRLREFRFDLTGAGGTPFLGWSCFLRRR
jgi:SAM-dependent methyltransferase